MLQQNHVHFSIKVKFLKYHYRILKFFHQTSGQRDRTDKILIPNKFFSHILCVYVEP